MRTHSAESAAKPTHPPAPRSLQITELLHAWHDGNAEAQGALALLVYDELRRQAVRALRRERDGHTLQPTALVHEAWLRLGQQAGAQWQGRTQFFAGVSRMMRRVLVDHARARDAAKRGGGGVQVSLAGVEAPAVDAINLIDLDDALERLARLDPRKAQLVDLRYFGGLSLPEVAEVLGVSLATAGREWSVARLWLRRELAP